MNLHDLNYLAILVAATVKFGLGGVWYSPALFNRQWLAEMKFTEEELAKAKAHGRPVLAVTFVLGLVQVFALAVVLRAMKPGCLGCVVGAAMMLSVAFAAVPIGINYLFERRSLRFFLINAGYDLVGLTLAGLVLGLMDAPKSGLPMPPPHQ